MKLTMISKYFIRLKGAKLRRGYKFDFSLLDVVYNSSPDGISSNYLHITKC
jgi:hypothetical protein